jgi:hypothetical protein
LSYAEFDDAIIVALSECNTYSGLCGRLETWANEIAGKDRHGGPNGWRLIDRRLQALRKAGKVTFTRRNGWSVATNQRGGD